MFIDNPYILGRVIGFFVMPFIIAYVIIWVVNRFRHQTKPSFKAVFLLALALMFLSFLGRGYIR